MVRAIFFDLDMCVLDTFSLKGSFFDEVINVLRSSSLEDALKEKIESQLWTTSLDDTAKMFALPKDILLRMREAYAQMECPDGITTYGDESFIKDLPVKKILVTTGYQRFQESKIRKLGIEDLFDEIIVDAIDVPELRKGKKKIFKELLKHHAWQASEVLVVGDNPVSELGAAKSLGIPTVQTLRPKVVKWGEADHHVASFAELASLIKNPRT